MRNSLCQISKNLAKVEAFLTMTRRGMMGLELVVPVEHFDDGGWSNSVEYHARYPAEEGAARMADGLKLLRYAKEAQRM